MKPPVKVQGKVIIEHNGMYDYLMMFPNGRVEHVYNRSDAEKRAKRYFKRRAHKDAINVGLIEWRTA